ncbi:SapC family protein [Sphingomonas sp. 8AM]|uniref:SapC family protein n=1 Tax=Sphingomonas sp. 8AM TaxID=2653170 RepID=UPI0012EFC88F|nr:SapC family protein [Sphingomonas sp. 8AM]VXD01628.1 SapC [Sphingomonas sp. 8AM]
MQQSGALAVDVGGAPPDAPAWELLNTDTHAGLRVRPATAAGRHFVQVVPDECARMAARCPLLFTKHPETGQFYIGALFGFEPGENLLVDADGRLDGYMPHDLERAGFFIAGDDIAIDRAHARFATADGVTLFDGGSRLRQVQHALAAINAGIEQTRSHVAHLLRQQLIEPIDLTLSFDDGRKITLDGLYTISRDALAQLGAAEVATLHDNGALRLAYTMANSLDQIALLARRRNDRLADA